ncbi:FtsX-like permease family protein [Tissierella sp.]|uniref:ABC transporter permease n=1 Tax=Tissierella sp. TaxID=41274 RepID=UPI00285C0FB2|nr:FtsX-like permease family protein [Tissierella sp.]MDR7857382.1 FtsX-like permease family protein [Tissierella sp.]
MKKIFMLSFANIRKSKGQAISLFIMFLVAGFLLNAGLLVFINFGNYFEKVAKNLNTSDAYYIVGMNLYNEKIDQYIKDNSNVSEMEKVDSLYAWGTIPYNDSVSEKVFVLYDKDAERNLSRWELVGDHLPTDSMSIYVPYVLKVDGGYKLDDKLEMKIEDTTITFTIKGFIEDVFFSSLDIGILGLYMPHETYENVRDILGNKYKGMVVFTNLVDSEKSLETGIRELIDQDKLTTSSVQSMDLSLVKNIRTMMAGMIAVMIVAFSVIIAIVCLIVIRFKISNNIEEDMTKIGSLKAIGYTSKQIIYTIALQFLLIALLGSVAGIGISYITIPVYSKIFESQSGLFWVQGFDSIISSVALSVVLLSVVIVTLISALRIRRLHPIVALRGGIITHNFTKSYFPLDRSKGNLNTNLAFKSIFQNIKQSLMIVVILTAVSFASTFAVMMFYNSVINTKAFSEVPGVELSNVIVVLDHNTNNEKMVKDIESLKDVRKVQFLDQTIVKINNNTTAAAVMDDYSKKETNSVYEGRYPIHSNEVVLSGELAEKLEKNIGDTVILGFDNREEEFMVTGLSQGMNMGPLKVTMRYDGIIKLNPNFKQENLQIYLNKDVNTVEFINKLKDSYGDLAMTLIDVDESMEQGMGVYITIVSKVGFAILVITIAIVIFVLYLIISSAIIRRKRELGIQKALGFTTLQLMNQISIGFMPPIIMGVIIGTIGGMTQGNGVMSIGMKAMSVMKPNFIVNKLWTISFSIAIVIVSYLTSMLITYSIRKISAYELISE